MASSDDWILGLGGSSHDFSSALMRGTDIVVAIEAERLTRVKHGRALWYEDPTEACVSYCLDAAGIARDDLSHVVSSDLLPYKVRDRFDGLPQTYYGHHLSHAASVATLLDNSDKAGIIVIDGMGSVVTRPELASPLAHRETFSFYLHEGAQLERLGGTYGVGAIEHTDFGNGCTNSIGHLYEVVTTLLGFTVDDAGKTMGLAGHGVPRFADDLWAYAQLGAGMSNAFTSDPFRSDCVAAIRSVLARERDSFEVRADLAASVQAVFTDTLLHSYQLIEGFEFDVLGLVGGCALNTVANGVLAKKLSSDRRLVVPPYCDDSGHAVGALWLHAREAAPGPFSLTFNGEPAYPHLARPGRLYPKVEIQRAVHRSYPKLAVDPTVTTPRDLAQVISTNTVVGVFEGRSEIGPRALGGRSLLADPRSAALKERINREVKHREPFRPLAPIVLADHYSDYFTPESAADPFMLVVAEANARCHREAPGVVHIDGTARVQTVDATLSPFVLDVLTAFFELTGVPLLINTSFNRRGEPIVETPADAVDAAIALGLDGLFLDGCFLVPAGSPRSTDR